MHSSNTVSTSLLTFTNTLIYLPNLKLLQVFKTFFSEPFLKKAKQRYNSPRTLSTRVNLADMSTELKLRPPHYIAEYEMIECNGRKAAYNEQSIPGDKSFVTLNVGSDHEPPDPTPLHGS